MLAGVLPKLASQAEDEWRVTYFRVSHSSSGNPFAALAKALVRIWKPALEDTQRLKQESDLAKSLQDETITLPELIDDIIHETPSVRLLLILDQFEELYTSVEDKHTQRKFLDVLLSCCEFPRRDSKQPILSLLVTIRADFISQTGDHNQLSHYLSQRALFLSQMSEDNLVQAIEKPAKLRGVSFQPGLVETILSDVGNEPGNLALLEFSLEQLWLYDYSDTVTHDAYREIGGVGGALAKHAQKQYDALDEHEQSHARRLFCHLVKLGEGTKDTRKVVSKVLLKPEDWQLAQKLANESSRLVVTAKGDVGTEVPEPLAEGGIETVEVIHEVLIEKWGKLREWVDEDRDFYRWQDEVLRDFHLWQQHGNSDDGLLIGNRLSRAIEWKSKREVDLSEDCKEYIRRSRALADLAAINSENAKRREEQNLKKQIVLKNRNAKIFTWLVGVLLMSSAGLLVAYVKLISEQQRAEISVAKYVAAKASEVAFLGDVPLGITLAAYSLNPLLFRLGDVPAEPDLTKVKEILPTLHRLLYRWDGLAPFIDEEPSNIFVLDAVTLFDSSGNEAGGLVVGADLSGQIWVWDENGELKKNLRPDIGEVRELYFSSSGNALVARGDEKAIVWFMKNNVVMPNSVTIDFFGDGVIASAINSSATQLLTVTEREEDEEQGTVVLWDIKNNHKIDSYISNLMPTALSFSNDGEWFVIGDRYGRVAVVNINQMRNEFEIKNLDGDWVNDVQVSFDQKYILAASDDSKVKVWDVETKILINEFVHDDWVLKAKFSPDGKRIFSVDDSRVGTMWNINSGMAERSEKGITDAAFVGNKLLSIGFEGIKARYITLVPFQDLSRSSSSSTTRAYWLQNNSELLLSNKVGYDKYRKTSGSALELVKEDWKVSTETDVVPYILDERYAVEKRGDNLNLLSFPSLHAQAHVKIGDIDIDFWDMTVSKDGLYWYVPDENGLGRVQSLEFELGKPLELGEVIDKSQGESEYIDWSVRFISDHLMLLEGDGNSIVWDPATNQILWEETGAERLEVVDGGILFVSNTDLWLVSDSSWEIKWKKPKPNFYTPYVFENGLYFLVKNDESFEAFSTSTGESLFKVKAENGVELLSVVDDGILFVSNTDLWLVSDSSGETKWRKTNPNIYYPIVSENGLYFLVETEEKLEVFSTSTGESLFKRKTENSGEFFGEHSVWVLREGVFDIKSGLEVMSESEIEEGGDEDTYYSDDGVWKIIAELEDFEYFEDFEFIEEKYKITANKNSPVKLTNKQQSSKSSDSKESITWDGIESFRFLPNSHDLVLVSKSGIRVINLDNNKELSSTGTHFESVTAMAVSADEKTVATADEDGEIVLWETETSKVLHQFRPHNKEIRHIGYSNSGTYLISVSEDNTAVLWHAKDHVSKCVFESDDPLLSAWVDPLEAYVVAQSKTGKITLWQTVTCNEVEMPSELSGEVNSVVFSPAGDQLLISRKSNAEIYALPPVNHQGFIKLEKVTSLPHSENVKHAIFSSNGSRVLTASGNKGCLWVVVDSPSHNEPLLLFCFESQQGVVDKVQYDPTGKYILTVSGNKVALWSITGLESASVKQPVTQFDKHIAPITGVTFNANASHVASTSVDGSVYVWRVFKGVTDTLDYVQTLPLAPLTENEIKIYLDID